MSRLGWYSLFSLSGIAFILGSCLMLVEEQNKRLQHDLKAAHQESAASEMRKQELLIELNSLASKSNLVNSAHEDLGMVGYEPASIVYLREKPSE